MSAAERDGAVVVTGGAGYIGTPLCLRLAAAGRRVRALDSLLHGQAEIAESLERAGIELIGSTSVTRSPAGRP